MKKNILSFLVGAIIFIALLVFAGKYIGWGKILSVWKRFTPEQLALVTGLTALSYLLRAIRVFDYFHTSVRKRFITVLRLSLLHNCIANLMPMRSGEAAFPLLMKREFSMPLTNSTTGLLWLRLLDLYSLGLLTAVIFLIEESAVYGTLLLVVLISAALFIWFWKQHHAKHTPENPSLFLKTKRFVLNNLPANPLTALRTVLWSLLSWGVKLFAYAYCVRIFAPVSNWQAYTGVVAAELSSVSPVHGIAGTGTYEGALTLALAPFGVDTGVALTAAINLHIFLLSCSITFALLALLLPHSKPST